MAFLNTVFYKSPLLVYVGFLGGIFAYAYLKEHLRASSDTREEVQPSDSKRDQTQNPSD